MKVLYRLLMAVVLVIAAIVSMGSAALAQGAEVVTPTANNVITFPLLLMTILSGLVIPIVHGVITKLGAKPTVRVLVGLTLSAIAGVLNSAVVLDGVAVLSETTMIAAALTWVVQMATHLGIYSPLNVPEKLAPNSGLG